MIEKIIAIKNMAKFEDYSCVGDLQFRRLTLIYAENGMGKSCIAAICRSVATGDPSHIMAKQTLAQDAPPLVQLLCDGTMLEFRNQAWSGQYPDIIVFDSVFVNSNVFSGDRVEHAHKRNLYPLIIGEANLQIAEEITAIDADVKELARRLSELEARVTLGIRGSRDFDAFAALPAQADIEERIDRQQARVDSLARAQELRSSPLLQAIAIPMLPVERMRETLRAGISDISAYVEDSFREHCVRLGPEGEDWIRTGTSFPINAMGTCPYCGQPTGSSPLVAVYSAYFSDAYSELKQTVQALEQELNGQLSSQSLMGLQRQLLQNSTIATLWGSHATVTFPEVDFDVLRGAWEAARLELLALLQEKAAGPLEPLELTDSAGTAIAAYDAAQSQLMEYNARISDANEKLAAEKRSLDSASLAAARQELEDLLDSRRRHEAPLVDLCAHHAALQAQKDAEIIRKEELRDRLSCDTAELMRRHQETLNEVLAKFGVEFEIDEAQTSFLGGRPSVSYVLKIRGQNIPLGTPDIADRPAFRTTLSDGEKNALAFGFFVAQCLRDPGLDRKTVVIDDPITSLDSQRRLVTTQHIVEIVQRAHQVVVLSHDAEFLTTLSQQVAAAKPLTIRRVGGASALQEWDMRQATISPHERDYANLKDYVENGREGSLVDVARSIRPLLEGYLRARFPGAFGRNEWLADFIAKIGAAAAGDRLASMQHALPELMALNDFSKKFHHESDADVEGNLARLTDGELRPWSKRALAVLET